ncbi:hypothetical protein [Nonomuraea sp. CA-141351]|uniref:hypothetical protein n=1 Tax=Nonomuraea sp. CA-141351 TaxID=3239996 RepID=UPI003D8BE05F
MAHDDTTPQPAAPHPAPRVGPTTFLAAASALRAIDHAIHTAHQQAGRQDSSPGTEQALAALLLLREVREHLDSWESGLIETARDAGASWAELAAPLGVASRQAAERRYLRLRPASTPGTTGEQRVKAERDRRAADRTITAWARAHAADLRRLAGQITSLDDLPDTAHTAIVRLTQALADNDAAHLLTPLIQATPHLRPRHPDLAARTQTLDQHTRQLRRDSDHQRRTLQ